MLEQVDKDTIAAQATPAALASEPAASSSNQGNTANDDDAPFEDTSVDIANKDLDEVMRADDLTAVKKKRIALVERDEGNKWASLAQATARQYARLIITPNSETAIKKSLRHHDPQNKIIIFAKIHQHCTPPLGSQRRSARTMAHRLAWCWCTLT